MCVIINFETQMNLYLAFNHKIKILKIYKIIN